MNELREDSKGPAAVRLRSIGKKNPVNKGRLRELSLATDQELGKKIMHLVTVFLVDFIIKNISHGISLSFCI